MLKSERIFRQIDLFLKDVDNGNFIGRNSSFILYASTIRLRFLVNSSSNRSYRQRLAIKLFAVIMICEQELKSTFDSMLMLEVTQIKTI